MTTDLSTIETTIAAALERLGNEHQRSADTAENKDAHRFFVRWAGAFRKAHYAYKHDGVRPESTPLGCWLVPSATRAGRVHQVDKTGHCTCEAKNQGCWHAALAVGIEVGMDDLDRFDGEDESEPPTPILVSRVAGGIALDRAGQHAVVRDDDPAALRGALEAFGARVCAA